MNALLLAAAALCFLVGLAHSVLGERLIFRRMRKGGVVPTNGGTVLLERHVRILWASWHIVTVFGWGMCVMLVRLALPAPASSVAIVLAGTVAATTFVAAAIVLAATRGRHPGWIGLLGVAILVTAWLVR